MLQFLKEFIEQKRHRNKEKFFLLSLRERSCSRDIVLQHNSHCLLGYKISWNLQYYEIFYPYHHLIESVDKKRPGIWKYLSTNWEDKATGKSVICWNEIWWNKWSSNKCFSFLLKRGLSIFNLKCTPDQPVARDNRDI